MRSWKGVGIGAMYELIRDDKFFALYPSIDQAKKVVEDTGWMSAETTLPNGEVYEVWATVDHRGVPWLIRKKDVESDG